MKLKITDIKPDTNEGQQTYIIQSTTTVDVKTFLKIVEQSKNTQIEVELK